MFSFVTVSVTSYNKRTGGVAGSWLDNSGVVAAAAVAGQDYADLAGLWTTESGALALSRGGQHLSLSIWVRLGWDLRWERRCSAGPHHPRPGTSTAADLVI